MFQFIGRVLGVAHNPGYPLYVFLTFPFSYVPIGSLAYRINLFSALLGAVAVGLTFLTGAADSGAAVSWRSSRRSASPSARSFWSQAVIAEVYTLHAAHRRRRDAGAGAVVRTQAGPPTVTRRWRCSPPVLAITRRLSALRRALRSSSCSTNPAFALRWRTLATTMAILLVRPPPIRVHPGSFARSRRLCGVASDDVRANWLTSMLAGQFRDRLFAFGWHTVLFDRVPFLFEQVLVPELTLPALCRRSSAPSGSCDDAGLRPCCCCSG